MIKYHMNGEVRFKKPLILKCQKCSSILISLEIKKLGKTVGSALLVTCDLCSHSFILEMDAKYCLPCCKGYYPGFCKVYREPLYLDFVFPLYLYKSCNQCFLEEVLS